MAWTFEITSGRLYSPEGSLAATGYAGGNCGKNPEGVNNPDMCGVRLVGPLPVGIYTFGTPVEHSHLGPFAIPLEPDPNNDMMGRAGFFMHGDVAGQFRAASEGCIIMGPMVRHACYASEDQQLRVVAALDE